MHRAFFVPFVRSRPVARFDRGSGSDPERHIAKCTL